AFFGKDGWGIPGTPTPRVLFSARLTWTSTPALFDARRIGNALSANGPGAVVAPPIQALSQRGEVSCAALESSPSAAQSQYGRPKLESPSACCNNCSSVRSISGCHGATIGGQ